MAQEALASSLVDLEQAWSLRSYDGDCDVVVEVEDRHAPWNAGRWRLFAAGGKGSIPQLTPAQKRVLEALCRPYKETEFATPATNQAIAEELFLSVDAVKAHLRALFTAFAIEDLPQNQKRSVLAMRAMQLGLVR